ncbi:MAG TPA: thioredoxin [Candidatus Pullichristensenella excrementigallinarum]|uniref:Thioredoxin n=1 Tax=Candidatus Pullichristensenella excrementigallinarum TaxID=2840907 RepID=A0A9D1LCM7_9FIRM|nr:thioredoxin [Candidatus Pullichristensenella excrementigallinarum]
MSENTIMLDGASMEGDALRQQGTILVDFWAPWCGPCRMVAPVLEQLAGEYAGKVKIGKINIDENPETAAQYGVSSIPTMILFREGKEIARSIGALPKPALKEFLDQNI